MGSGGLRRPGLKLPPLLLGILPDLFFHQLMVDGVSKDHWLCLIENYRGFDWIVNDHFQY